jgi:hypothetical protein
MKKSVVLILLLNICLGIVAPTIVALNDHSLEEGVVLVNIEKDIEMEEEELDETVFFFEPQLKEGKKNTLFSLTFRFNHHYQDIYLKGGTPPPQNVI